jgi:hypothetical protein
MIITEAHFYPINGISFGTVFHVKNTQVRNYLFIRVFHIYLFCPNVTMYGTFTVESGNRGRTVISLSVTSVRTKSQLNPTTCLGI